MRRRVSDAGPRRDRRLRAASSAGHSHDPRGPAGAPQQRRGGAPWHFWLVVAMATLYLGWRAVEGVVWLVQWLVGVIG